MNHIFYGFGVSVLFGCTTALILWPIVGATSANAYANAFFSSFNFAISGGLVFSAAILIYNSQNWIPNLIDNTFSEKLLLETEYGEYKRRFLSASRSASFATIFIAIGFFIFKFAKFPFDGLPEAFLIAFCCLEYGLGVYVGRKLFYIAQMLHAIEKIPVEEDIFKEDKLGIIATYVNSISTITAIFVFAVVMSQYYGPFKYDSPLGENIRLALLLPAIIAIPVVALFNFYPRTVLKTLYARSIDRQVDRIKEQLRDEKLSDYERLSYIIEYDKTSKDELRYRLKASLSDLPIAITIVLMIVGVLLK
ncbi:hypothetical protein [Roseibium sp. Sym1]|uniref:hypothetical protein n=1 Tax=Roseibium sp. Sym1 TaxID=3016006 RepID=UPI0022B39640|nr:hypothetical protein [Roseibium sp. Sym1]